MSTWTRDGEHSRQSVAIAAAIASVTLVGIGLSLSTTLLALRLAEQGYSARAIGFNSAAGGVATLLIAPYVPALARRLGVLRLLILALLTGALSLIAFADSTGFWPWLAIRLIFGAALTVLFVLSEFWISSVVWPQRRGLILGLYTTSIALGFAAGPALLAWTGMQGPMPFLVAMALFVLAALPIGLVAEKAPSIELQTQTPVMAFVAAAPAATLAALVYGAIEAAGMGLLPVYALRSGMGATTGAFLVTIFALGNASFQTPVGVIADRVDRRLLLAVIAGLGVGGALVLPLAKSAGFAAFATLLFTWSGAVGSLYAVGLGQLGTTMRRGELASINAAYITSYAAGALVGPPILGFGLDITPAGLFIAIATMLAAYLWLVCRSPPRS